MNEVLSLCLSPLIWALNLFYEILQKSQFFGAYIAFFFVYTVVRLFIRPLVGAALSFPASNINEERRTERREKAKAERRKAQKGGHG